MSQSSKPKPCDKKIKTAEIKLNKIINKIGNLKLNDSYISRLNCKSNKIKIWDELLKKHVVFVLISAVFGLAYWIYSEFSSSKCLLEIPSISKTAFRPPEDCSMCDSVTEVARVANISSQEFEEKYAYGAHPLIVIDAASHWKALREFNYEFFKNFYLNNKMGTQVNDCFFFSYKSGLNSLHVVFSMDERRANLSGEPWYVGWSTCYDEETRALRGYYTRPYFLPRTAESDMVDWIFMGGPGQGAHMHVDSVRHMSWQAQVRGRKRWTLAPPPECLYRCRWLHFTVHPAEILVVDTNRWYHRTEVLPGDISITIGAEYD